MAYERLDVADTTNWVLRQQHLAPGSPVCVFGRFSQAQSAIVSPRGGGSVRVIRGHVEQVAAGLRSKAMFRGLLGLALGGGAGGVLWMIVSRTQP